MALYLDNAATSYPKPTCVIEAMQEYSEHVGANSGRSAHRQAQEASRIVFEARESVARLIGSRDSSRVIFTSNATEGLNIAILGLLDEGDQVITTRMEHNSVMRPLRYLEKIGSVKVDAVPCSSKGELDPDDIKRRIVKETKLIVMISASNVCGTLMAVRDVAGIARERGVHLLVDAAQTAGCMPLDVVEDSLELVAFSGHKGLMGPQGTGCLYVGEGVKPRPLYFGGTGSRSEHEIQPEFLPDKFESGTPNIIGIAGLGAAVQFVLKRGVDRIRTEEERLTGYLLDKLARIDGVVIQGPEDPEQQVGVVSINVSGIDPSEVGYALDARYDIAVRVGLHCAPAAHRTLGTFPGGTVRISPGPFTNTDDIDLLCSALTEIARCNA
jgi:cysteine desulfurase family protein